MIAIAAALLAAAPMVKIPAGQVTPFYKTLPAGKRAAAPPRPIDVRAFRLAQRPVSRGEWRDFVRDQAQWRRSAIARLFADENYLASWSGDLDPGAAIDVDAPVTEVSWFAAKAYCRALGLRLPTTAEWELALQDEGRDRAGVTERILRWYQAPRSSPAVPDPANGLGVRDLVGSHWEWTLDFDTAPLAPDARGSDGALFCGSAGAQAADPADQATFMRYAFRSSLKANYTTKDLGFRCAGDDR